MANPGKAFHNTHCDGCSDLIPEGDSVFFTDDGNLCEECAEEGDFVCPDCGEAKKSEYRACYGCSLA